MASINLTAENAHEFKAKMLSLKPHDFATKSSLKLFTDATAGLGSWMDLVPPSIREDYQHATRIPIMAFRNSAANFQKWKISHQSVRMRVWPYPFARMLLWYQNRRALDLERWQQAGIADAIDLSFQPQSTGANKALMMAAACFWDTSSNTFNFKFWQMGITLLDLHPEITDFPDNQVLGMAFAGVKAHDPLDYSDCFQHLYTLDASALDASELMLNQMYPEALANKFMWCTTHSPETMHLFEQAISITNLRLPDDAGFELYAPNHFACQLGFQQEIPFPLLESVNMYNSWHLKRKGKKQTDDPRFQPNFTQFKVNVRSISLLFASKEVSQTYNAWWSMICGELWTIDPLHLFKIIFANGRTLLPRQDQALFGEGTSASHVHEVTPTANQETVEGDENPANLHPHKLLRKEEEKKPRIRRMNQKFNWFEGEGMQLQLTKMLLFWIITLRRMITFPE
ncbi:hypothetical protein ACLB2K_072393 [Fragaria x ananassa]